MKKLLGKLRKAIIDFNLIEEGDKIAVGLSGGKDSITLLHLLKRYQKFSPEHFDLIAITLDIGLDTNFNKMESLCNELDIPYYLIKTDIKKIVFDIKKEKNPCSLCSNLRRGALNNTAKNLNCNKVALGHNKNDAIETLLLSMFYEGRINCFSPKTYLDRVDITVIRPMIYIDEIEINNANNKFNFPIIESTCPADGFTKREYIKNLIYNLEKDIPDIKDKLLTSLINTKELKIWDKSKFK